MKKILAALTLCFLLFTPLFADAVESAKAHAHYEHPVTGMIEDAGNNPGIGQGMTQNILHEKALFEESDGKYYLTVRYHMIDNIDKVTFAVQQRGEDKFYKREYVISAETAETRDYRIEVPSKDIIVRSGLFVIPMGREVIFYSDFSDFAAGNTDFKLLGEGGIASPAADSQGAPATEGEVVETKAVNDLIQSGELGYEHGLLMRDSEQIQALLKKGAPDPIHPEEGVKQAEATALGKQRAGSGEWGFVTKTLFQGFVLLLVLLSFFLMVAAIVLYISAKHMRRINSVREVMLYEED